MFGTSDHMWLGPASLEESEQTALITGYDRGDDDGKSIRTVRLQGSPVDENRFKSFEQDDIDVIEETPKHNWRSYI